jgi:glycolate oxidase iron-sulfur subunit
MDVAFAEVNLDTVRLLLHHDCEVIVPGGQACCGSLQAHNGGLDAAREMAKGNMLLFDRDDLDFIVLNSAGCGAFMKEYAHLFADDPDWSERAKRISAKVLDITEFLVRTGYRPSTNGGAQTETLPRFLHERQPNARFRGKRIGYHDACHLVHTQKITQQPRQLIRMVPGIEFVEIPEASWCCGSAGIYNIVHYDDSMKLLERKVENIASVAPDVVVTGNPGCLLQIQHGLRKRGMNVELMHTATFLWRACDQ